MKKSLSLEKWDELIESYDKLYDEAIASLNKPNLVELNKWFVEELPQLIKKRSIPHVTQPELSKLMRWKLTFGKWRPRLQKFIDELTHEQVYDATKEAFALLKESSDEYKQAMGILTKLKGVGPATASAILTAYDPQYPYMGDAALEALSSEIGKRQYTSSHYCRFVECISDHLKWLLKNSKSSIWTGQHIQICFFIHHTLESSEPPRKKPRRQT